eukprot:12278515-Alexandrium_andersonii.AAC.1
MAGDAIRQAAQGRGPPQRRFVRLQQNTSASHKSTRRPYLRPKRHGDADDDKERMAEVFGQFGRVVNV